MADQSTTVDVDASVYNHTLPDWYEGDTVPIEVLAYDNKVYLDFPRFGRIENRIQKWLNSDSPLINDGDKIELSELTTREQVIEMMVERDFFDPTEAPSQTRQFLVKAESLFRAVVEYNGVDRDGEHEFQPIQSQLQTDRDTLRVTTRICNGELDMAHQSLVESFAGTVIRHIDTEYWRGYAHASNLIGNDLAFSIFEQTWEGNSSLMLLAGEWMAKQGETVSDRSNAFFPIPDWGTTPGGNYVATIAQCESRVCPECGSDLDDTSTCTYSSNRTTKANKYQCDPEDGGCGYRYSGITTG
jgi:hypothetical protein